jgi:hypothetical protein
VSFTGTPKISTVLNSSTVHRVFYNPAIPIVPGYIPTESNTIAQYTIANKPADSLMFVQDLSAGDPASLGVSILLANHTLDVNYTSAVNQQNDYLLRVAPRTEDGALSHRVRDVQLWSDFLAMVPPYLAYYGALTKNDGYLQAACKHVLMRVLEVTDAVP